MDRPSYSIVLHTLDNVLHLADNYSISESTCQSVRWVKVDRTPLRPRQSPHLSRSLHVENFSNDMNRMLHAIAPQQLHERRDEVLCC